MAGSTAFLILTFIILNNNLWYFFTVSNNKEITNRFGRSRAGDIINAVSAVITAAILLIPAFIWFMVHVVGWFITNW